MAKTEQEIVPRSLANFPPSVWGCSFAELPPQYLELESHTKEMELFKEKVKFMLMESTKDIAENIEFINLLCRLGVSYHFEGEIEQQLQHIFVSLPQILTENDFDLYVSALLFRVLRQHGLKMPCDVFKKFKDMNGEFKKCIMNDVKGLLSLYEATFLSVAGETILDEALVFTREHLETQAEKSNPNVAKHIKNALLSPFHHSPERIEILLFIPFYEGEESRNETLLKFAKLDFNRRQLLYRNELASLSRWWRDLNLIKMLPYTRDRIVEAFIWGLGVVVDPRHSHARLLFAKHLIFVTVVDDTYDAYGTVDELELFTAVIQRFGADADDELPEYMKCFYKVLMNFFEETENDGTERSAYKSSFAIEMLKEISRAYFTETRWLKNGIMPTYHEYMQNGIITSTFDFHSSAFILGVENLGMQEIVWLRDNSGFMKTAKTMIRLLNDIVIRKDEEKRKTYPSSVRCYMKEHSISEEKAREEIEEIFKNGWKETNENLMKPSIVSKIFLKFLLDFLRMAEFTYHAGDDIFTNGSALKAYVNALITEPLPM